MSRLCMRSRCDRPAEVRLSYDTIACQVWLDPLSEHLALSQQICEFHAKRLKLPVGWELQDRRTRTPTLFDTAALLAEPIAAQPDLAALMELKEAAVRRATEGSRRGLARSRHPSLNPSELFAAESLERSEPAVGPAPGNSDSPEGRGSAPMVDCPLCGRTVDTAHGCDGLDVEYISLVVAGQRSIDRVVLLEPDRVDEKRDHGDKTRASDGPGDSDEILDRESEDQR